MSQSVPLIGLKLNIKLVMAAMFWGGTFTAGSVLIQTVPLITAAFGRFLVAAVLLVWLSTRLEGGLPRLSRSQVTITAALGLTGIFFYNIFFLSALSYIPASRTSLFVSLTPIVTTLLASMIFRERLHLKSWLGIGVALIGAMIVITRGDLAGALQDIRLTFGKGETMMLLAVLSWAAYTLISRIAMESLSPLAATTYATLWGLAFLALGAAREASSVQWSTLSWQTFSALLYLGSAGTVVAFMWYQEGIRAIGPSRTAVFTNLVPAFGVPLSAIILSEDLLISMLLGGIVSIVGVTLTNQKQSRP